MNGKKSACFLNNEVSFMVHIIAHNFFKKSYNMSGLTFFLKNRFQRAVLNGHISKCLPVQAMVYHMDLI